MRDPTRIPKVLEAVRRVWNRSPDLRFFQLVGNLIADGEDPCHKEDVEFLRRLRETYPDAFDFEDDKPTDIDAQFVGEALGDTCARLMVVLAQEGVDLDQGSRITSRIANAVEVVILEEFDLTGEQVNEFEDIVREVANERVEKLCDLLTSKTEPWRSTEGVDDDPDTP